MKQNFPLFTLVSCRLAPNAVIAIFVGKKTALHSFTGIENRNLNSFTNRNDTVIRLSID